MVKKLDEMIVDYQAARKRLREAETKLQEAVEEATRLLAALPSLRSEIGWANEAKAKAIHRYILKEITEAEMDEAKSKVEEAKETGKKQTEAIDALLRLKVDIEEDLPRLREEIQKTSATVLKHLVEGLRKETKELVGDRIAVAWSLSCLVGTAVDYQQFLELIFPAPPSEVMTGYQSEYQHKYLGNEELKNEC